MVWVSVVCVNCSSYFLSRTQGDERARGRSYANVGNACFESCRSQTVTESVLKLQRRRKLFRDVFVMNVRKVHTAEGKMKKRPREAVRWTEQMLDEYFCIRVL